MWKPMWLLLASFAPVVFADFFEGALAYHQKDFKKAQQEFAELLPLGNGAAVFNLAIMAYQGQGEPADPIKTAALLILAAELGEKKAEPTAKKLMASLDAAQQRVVKQLLMQYQSQVIISPEQRGWLSMISDPKVDKVPKWLEIVRPVFSQKASLNGLVGSVDMLVLLEKDGTVLFIDSNESLGRDLFTKSTKSAVQKWQFEPLAHRFIYRLEYHFFYDASLSEMRYARLASMKALQQPDLLQMVQQDSAAHQFAFGKILQRLEYSTEVAFHPDEKLVASQPIPDRMLYQSSKEPRTIDPMIKDGAVIIRVNALNRIETVLTDTGITVLKNNDFNLLKDRAMPEAIAEGWYYLNHGVQDDGVEENYLWDLQRVPPEHYSGYWISLAARNGDLTAQRELAFRRSDWRKYLQQKNDPKALLWAGMFELQNGNDQQAKTLLLNAKAAGESQVDELLKVLQL